MTASNDNRGLVIRCGIDWAGEGSVSPSGNVRGGRHGREFGYWRGSTAKSFQDKFTVFMPVEGSGVYAGQPVVSIPGSGLNTSDGCSAFDSTWEWIDSGSGPEWVELTSACSAQEGCTGTPPTEDGETDGTSGETEAGGCTGGSTSSRYEVTGGSSSWTKGGALNSLSPNVPDQRTIYLSRNANINLGSGVCTGKEFTAYAKILPSGDPSDSVIFARHKFDPAQFVLGCDYDGHYYIRSDAEVSGINTPYYARSVKRFDSFNRPTHIVGTYCNSSSSLKIYVNGKLEGTSEPFARDTRNAANTDILFGKKPSPFTERGFRGWVDEFGVACSCVLPSEINDYYNSHFNLAKFIEEAVPPTGGSIHGQQFNTAFDASDEDYISFVIESGVNGEKTTKGGAYEMWPQLGNAVSSTLSFSLKELPEKFWQLASVKVDMWVENNTTNASGVNLFASMDTIDKTAGQSIKWEPDMIYLPSGGKELITFSGALPHYYTQDGSISFRPAFQNHKLNLTVAYPDSTTLYDADFKIYSTKVRFERYDRFHSLNTTTGKDGNGFDITDNEGYITGADTTPRDLKLFVQGGEFAKASGILPMFTGGDTVVQSLDLIMNHEPVSGLGNTGFGTLAGNAGVTTVGDWSMFIRGGMYDIRLPLYLQTAEWNPTNQTLPLHTRGDTDVFPYAANSLNLFLKEVVAGSGFINSSMNIAMPKVGNASLADRRLLYIRGDFNKTLPLFISVNEKTTQNISLYTLAPSQQSASGIMNLYLDNPLPELYTTSKVKSIPSVLTNNNLSLNVSGIGSPSGILRLNIPNVLGSGTTSTHLYIGGYRP